MRVKQHLLRENKKLIKIDSELCLVALERKLYLFPGELACNGNKMRSVALSDPCLAQLAWLWAPGGTPGSREPPLLCCARTCAAAQAMQGHPALTSSGTGNLQHTQRLQPV